MLASVPPSQIASASRQSTRRTPPVPPRHLGFLLQQPVFFLLLGAERKNTFKNQLHSNNPPPPPRVVWCGPLTWARQRHLGSGRRRRVLGDVPRLGGGFQVRVRPCAVHHLLIGPEGGLGVHGDRVVGRRDLVLRGKRKTSENNYTWKLGGLFLAGSWSSWLSSWPIVFYTFLPRL